MADLDIFIDKVKHIYLPKLERPPEEHVHARADFDARVLLGCMNSSGKAGMLRSLKTCIQRLKTRNQWQSGSQPQKNHGCSHAGINFGEPMRGSAWPLKLLILVLIFVLVLIAPSMHSHFVKLP